MGFAIAEMYLISRISGLFSLIGSSYVIRCLLVRYRKNKSVSTIEMILFCISISDTFSSVSCWILGGWPVPTHTKRDPPDGDIFYGNTATCTMQGFVFQWSSFSSSYYSAMFAIYQVLIVVRGCGCCRKKFSRNHLNTVSNKQQVLWLALPLILSLLLAMAALFDRAYNFNGTTCHIATHPITCTVDVCDRGKHKRLFMTINALSLGLCFVIIIVSMIILFRFVLKTERRVDRYAFRNGIQSYRRQGIGGQGDEGQGDEEQGDKEQGDEGQGDEVQGNEEQGDEGQGDGRQGGARKNFKKVAVQGSLYIKAFFDGRQGDGRQGGARKCSKKVAVQGLLYIGAFFLTWIFSLVIHILARSHVAIPLWVTFSFHIFLPMQGFLNAIIYASLKLKIHN